MQNSPPGARTQLLEAARSCILQSGYASLTTRKVADQAGVPLSQIHYHFGSKRALVLALLNHINHQRRSLYLEVLGEDLPLAEIWVNAGHLLLEDFDSGYTRVMHELMAVGYSDPAIASQVADQFTLWNEALSHFGERLAKKGGALGPLTAIEFGALLDAAALGINQQLLLGVPREKIHALSALGKFGPMLQELDSMTEEQAS